MTKEGIKGIKKSLTERQFEYVKSLQTHFDKVWMAAVNKKVADALIRKGICKIVEKDYLALTKLGKSL